MPIVVVVLGSAVFEMCLGYKDGALVSSVLKKKKMIKVLILCTQKVILHHTVNLIVP